MPMHRSRGIWNFPQYYTDLSRLSLSDNTVVTTLGARAGPIQAWKMSRVKEPLLSSVPEDLKNLFHASASCKLSLYKSFHFLFRIIIPSISKNTLAVQNDGAKELASNHRAPKPYPLLHYPLP